MRLFLCTATFLFVVFFAKKINADRTYNIIHERAQLLSYNESIVHDVQFSFSKFNRTTFALNVSFVLINGITDPRNMLRVNVDKMYGTEYKRTGTSFKLDLCKFLNTNALGVGASLKAADSNLWGCVLPPKKYYLYNFLPDSSLFPRFLPLGSYRVIIDVFHENGSKYFLLYWFAKVEKKVNY